MSKKDEALKLALEASEVLEALFNQAEAMHKDMTAGVNVHCQITVADLSKGLYAAHAIREALAEQPAHESAYQRGYMDGIAKGLRMEQPAQQKTEFVSPGGGYVPAIPRPLPLDWKLVPRTATPEMLKAMDECAQEGYDERLYEGMASSVYMAAWDASPTMGTLPEQPAQQPVVEHPPCQGMNCGITRTDQEHSLECQAEHAAAIAGGAFVKPAQQQEPVARSKAYDMIDRFLRNNLNSDEDYAEYSTALDSLYTSPPASKPLTDEEIWNLASNCLDSVAGRLQFARAIEAAHGITGEQK